MLLRWSLLYVLITVLLHTQLTTGSTRSLLQRQRDERVVQTEEELREALESDSAVQTVIVDALELELSQPLIIIKAGVQLEGRSDGSTILRCSDALSRQSALLIRAGDVQIRSLEITECREQSAVFLEPVPGDRLLTMDVSFENVTFSNNGWRRRGVLGGALRVGSCPGLSCLRPFLSLRSCSFLQNQAMYGGAMHLTDSDLIISDSTFRENRADLSGGAIYSGAQYTTTTLIEASLFEDNRALSDPEVHGMSEPELLATPNQTLAYVGMGGAIFADHLSDLKFDLCTFVHNIGCRGGGGIAVMSGELLSAPNITFAFSLIHSLFRRNEAYCGDQRDALRFDLVGRNDHLGGAMWYLYLSVVETEWIINRTTFLENRARSGGALALQSTKLGMFEHFLSSCTFLRNVGLISGGAMTIITVQLTMINCRLQTSRAVYGAGIMVWRGAVLRTEADPARPDSLNIIDNSTGIYGGAIYSDIGGYMDLASLVLRNNVAFRYGAGLRVYNVGTLVILRGILIEGNRALSGGGVAILSLTSFTITSDSGRPTIFRNNQAVVGGGLYYEPGHYIALYVRVENAEFTDNRALPIASLEMSALLQEDIEFQALPEANVQLPDIDEQLGNFTLFNFLTEVPEGHGGGIGITLVSIRLFTLVEVVFQNLTLTGNEAMVGGPSLSTLAASYCVLGGISAHMTNLHWNRLSSPNCDSAAFGFDACQMFSLHNVTITENTAYYAAGIFATLPQGIQISCSPESTERLTSDEIVFEEEDVNVLEPYCSNVTLNRFSQDPTATHGFDGGTNAAYLRLEGWDGPLNQVASGEHLSVPCNASRGAGCHASPRIAILDIFNQTIVRGIEDANLTLSLISDDIAGDLRYTAVNGIAVIDKTVAWGVNRSSNVTVVADQDRSVSLVLDFSTRPCYPGELRQDRVCESCPTDQYSFTPDKTSCRACETHAKCVGGAALVPVPGYWHSTPFSPAMHRCIHPEACDYGDRDEILREFYNDGSRLQILIDELDSFLEGNGEYPDFSDYLQCAAGYAGVLCGSCHYGYGHSQTDACHKCSERSGVAGLFIILGALWTFCLIGINCTITLMSTTARVQLVQHELHSATHRRPRVLQRAKPVRRIIGRSSRMVAARAENPGSAHRLGDADPQMQAILCQQLVATVQLTETLKILINYCQVTSTALQLQVDWSPLLTGLLSFEATLAGFADEVLKAPFECQFDNNGSTPASLTAWWFRLATPWIIMLALLLVFTLGWFSLRLHSRFRTPERLGSSDRQRLLTSLIIIAVVSTYFSYIDVVRELYRGINCIEIESAEEMVAADHPFIDYAVGIGHDSVWVEDTDRTCFRGSHLPVSIVAIVGLLISFCGIISIIVWPPLNKKHVTNTQFISRYWFLYQAYRKEWYTNAWESTILTRKALIAAVVVFSVHLGPTLQASMCTGILVIAHIVQFFLSPFKVPESHEYVPEYTGQFFRLIHVSWLAPRWIAFNNSIHLNSLESASLASSIILFFSAVFLNDDDTSRLGRGALVAFTFAVNSMFVIFMCYRLYAGVHVFLDLKLEVLNSSFMATRAESMGLSNLFFKVTEVVRVRMSPQEEEFDEELDREISGSNVTETLSENAETA